MRSPEGGFYSSLDADSEGREGKFYLWDAAEVRGILNADEYAAFAARFGMDDAPNFDGAWHLRAARARSTETQVEAMIDGARARLLARRDTRVRPACDEKVLTAWNGLMIKGLAIAARALRRPDLGERASAAVDFIRDRLWQDGRLLAAYKDGRARLPAYLDDYAFLADALLELLQTRWRTRDLEFLVQLVEVLLAKFADRDVGGFFFTASDHERLIHRSKSFGDESLPAGNSVAAGVLDRLGYLLGEPRYLDAARRTLTAALPMMTQLPMEHMSALNALHGHLAPVQIVIVRGAAAEARHWACELGCLYEPSRLVFAIPGRCPRAAARTGGQARRARHRRLRLHRNDVLAADRGSRRSRARAQNAPAGPGNSIGLANPSAETDETPKK